MPSSGAVTTVWSLNAGISGASMVSKSICGTALNRPSDSFTAAARICQIGNSFSNLISVFVGCIFTSILSGSTEKFRK